jgi:hypothetical protein
LPDGDFSKNVNIDFHQAVLATICVILPPAPSVLQEEKDAIQTSKQITDYLLCRNCENRLNRNGENYFLKICWRRTGSVTISKGEVH